MKFRIKLPTTMENVLELFHFFKINSIGKIEFQIYVSDMVLVVLILSSTFLEELHHQIWYAIPSNRNTPS